MENNRNLSISVRVWNARGNVCVWREKWSISTVNREKYMARCKNRQKKFHSLHSMNITLDSVIVFHLLTIFVRFICTQISGLWNGVYAGCFMKHLEWFGLYFDMYAHERKTDFERKQSVHRMIQMIMFANRTNFRKIPTKIGLKWLQVNYPDEI